MVIHCTNGQSFERTSGVRDHNWLPPTRGRAGHTKEQPRDGAVLAGEDSQPESGEWGGYQRHDTLLSVFPEPSQAAKAEVGRHLVRRNEKRIDVEVPLPVRSGAERAQDKVLNRHLFLAGLVL